MIHEMKIGKHEIEIIYKIELQDDEKITLGSLNFQIIFIKFIIFINEIQYNFKLQKMLIWNLS